MASCAAGHGHQYCSGLSLSDPSMQEALLPLSWYHQCLLLSAGSTFMATWQ